MAVPRRLAAIALALTACPSADDGSDGAAGTTAAASTGIPTTSDDTAASVGTTTSPGDGSSSGGPVELPQVCTRACDLPADCCPVGQEGCPSGFYPGNYGCQEGACVPAQCETDAECETETAGTTCHPVDGLMLCVAACSEDNECPALGTVSTCSATADDGTEYCFEHCADNFCTQGTCDMASGQCRCETVDECAAAFTCPGV